MGIEKYYTPDIEEFHVGFEYESFETCFTYGIKPINYNLDGSFSAKVVSEPKEESAWIKKMFSFQDMVSLDYSREELVPDIKLNFDSSKTRVKYLDRDDIEGCGWESQMVVNVWSDDGDIISGFVVQENNTDTYVLLYDEESRHLGVYMQRIYNELTGNWEEHRLFSGTIKNKSELKKLMKQLGING